MDINYIAVPGELPDRSLKYAPPSNITTLATSIKKNKLLPVTGRIADAPSTLSGAGVAVGFTAAAGAPAVGVTEALSLPKG